MHHIQVLIELIVTGTLSSAITYGICAWPLRVENARLRAKCRQYLDCAAAILDHHEEVRANPAVTKLIDKLENVA